MNIEVFTLCDAATDYSGKLNILGTFDAINFKQLPATFPHCAIALRIRFSKIEAGHHKVQINFVNQDGKPFMPSLNGDIQVRIAPEKQSTTANLILGVNNLKFEKDGPYTIDLAVDSRHEQSLPLFVKLLQRNVQN
jgi:hypothetical protein